MRRVRAYIGLGANLGDAAGTLAAAVRALAALPGAHLRAVSRLYATEPVGVVDQPEFRNAVVALDVPVHATTTAGGPVPDLAAGAIELLLALKRLEREFGRRSRRRWGERELDLDILVFGRARLELVRPPDGLPTGTPIELGGADRLLVVPHLDARERLFVLAPLADLAPGLAPPGWGETVATARGRREAVEGPNAVRAVARWDSIRSGWEGLAGVA